MPHALDAAEWWHAIVLRGRNSATYKLALAWCMVQFIEEGKMRVTWDELAQAFLDVYVDRLRNGLPQLSDPAHASVMERIVHGYNSGEVDRAHAVAQVRTEAFSDVIQAFHIVDLAKVPVRFFNVDGSGLALTEEARWVITREGTVSILAEVEHKWSDLESTWAKSRSASIRPHDEDVVVWVADVGSIARRKFGWCKAVPHQGTVQTGTDITAFAGGICTDLSFDKRVALGFECPLFIPVPNSPSELGKARDGDGDRAWSAAAGCAAMATGLAESAWVFRKIRRAAGSPVIPTLAWDRFHNGEANLFVWEAFISGDSKVLSHQGDAEVAARAFLGHYPDIGEASLVKCSSPLSLAATAMNWAGFQMEGEALRMPCVVIGASR